MPGEIEGAVIPAKKTDRATWRRHFFSLCLLFRPFRSLAGLSVKENIQLSLKKPETENEDQKFFQMGPPMDLPLVEGWVSVLPKNSIGPRLESKN